MKNSRDDKKISRGEFLKYGFAAVLGAGVFGIAGCRQPQAQKKPPVPMAQVQNFIGNPSTRVYHKLNCKLAPEKTKAVFFDSPIAAKHAGFRPCRVCKPLKP